MAKWVISGNTFDLNPEKDTGWIYEEVRSEHHVSNSGYTNVQSSGHKSGTRTIQGITKSKSLRDALLALYLSGNKAAMSDQDGASFNARINECEFPVKIDVSNDINTYQAYEYKIVLMKR